ncbi:prefoldin subunit 5 [Schizosaccharomyces japonicus yFS275]|uniref:Prefoldin subunit 5 n=1 Tax=Schizosaccharomyces japonicus (strain yFS275 / FY16936) TaxID=402676 RepID=B6K5N6_SCHJY|nr:prefoldin subunit 5 [Schizosaccharomyces japonicus yFS275]EEB08840.1 prefoldin subunit 5 [Schizosaccharomyces japonicus yFS275]
MSTPETQSIDLTKLSIEQLSELVKQLNSEIDYLATSSAQLSQALTKFTECISCVKNVVKDENNGKEILVPLTASLYVPGRFKLKDNKVLVDIGTGYFVEKTAEEAAVYYEGKCEYLRKSIGGLEGAIDAKNAQVRAVQQITQEKFMKERKTAAK